MSTVTDASLAGSYTLSEALLTVHSAEILFAAQPALRFQRAATIRRELEQTPGSAVQFLKYAALTGAHALTELTAMTTSFIDGSSITITPTEHGKAVAFTEKLMRQSFDDIMASAVRLLGAHYAQAVDGDIRDALLGNSNVLYANGRSGRTVLTSSDTMSIDFIRDGVQNLATNKAPKYQDTPGGPAYLCYVHPAQARDLRADDEWKSATQYGDPSRAFNGEIGRFEDVIFYETTQIPYVDTSGNIYADGVDTGTDTATYNASINVYRAVMCGDYSVAMAVQQEVQLRDGGVVDYGRQHNLAWYAMYGVGRYEDNHSVVLESAV